MRTEQLREEPGAARSEPILSVRELSGGYGQLRVLRRVELEMPEGTVCALLGRNGVGKTTLLRTVAGLLKPHGGRVVFRGVDVTGMGPQARAALGLCVIPEGRAVFRDLTVAENIRLFAPASIKSEAHERVYSLFPRLAERRRHLASQMSGGEQQMLALARAFLASPSVVLVDEPSFGLAPKAIDVVFDALAALAAGGVTILLVEQYVERALHIARDVYVMDKGELSYVGEAHHLTAAEVTSRYFGNESDLDRAASHSQEGGEEDT
jgi:branched-chain amino acid transport system ATP-binding protein